MANESTTISMIGFAKATVYFEMIFSVGMVNEKIYLQYMKLIKALNDEGFPATAVVPNDSVDIFSASRIVVIEQMRDYRRQIIRCLSLYSGNMIEDIEREIKSKVCENYVQFLTNQFEKG